MSLHTLSGMTICICIALSACGNPIGEADPVPTDTSADGKELVITYAKHFIPATPESDEYDMLDTSLVFSAPISKTVLVGTHMSGSTVALDPALYQGKHPGAVALLTSYYPGNYHDVKVVRQPDGRLSIWTCEAEEGEEGVYKNDEWKKIASFTIPAQTTIRFAGLPLVSEPDSLGCGD